jgi:hypothetical protein
MSREVWPRNGGFSVYVRIDPEQVNELNAKLDKILAQNSDADLAALVTRAKAIANHATAVAKSLQSLTQ